MYVETVGTQGFPWREGSRIARLRAYLQRRFFVVTYQRMDYAPMASEGERSAFLFYPISRWWLRNGAPAFFMRKDRTSPVKPRRPAKAACFP